MDIRIVYCGRMKNRTNLKSEVLDLERQPEKAERTLKAHLTMKYGIVPPYNILINNRSLTGAVKKNIELEEGDEIRILPYMSGG